VIRQARRADVPAIAAQWNRIIRETVITFNPQEKSEVEVWRTILSRARLGHPFLVAKDGEALLGFATHAQFRAGLGYARSMEHSVQLAEGARGQGLGRRLMTALEDHATARGMRAMVGAITAENTASIAFHAALGYVEVGRMPQVGWKFGRYHDLVLMQKLLDPPVGDSGPMG
jgi:phosphinothricin acetyltransferase